MNKGEKWLEENRPEMEDLLNKVVAGLAEYMNEKKELPVDIDLKVVVYIDSDRDNGILMRSRVLDTRGQGFLELFDEEVDDEDLTVQ